MSMQSTWGGRPRGGSARTYSARASLQHWWSAFRSQSFGFKLACLYVVMEYVRPQSLFPVLQDLPLAMIIVILGILAMVPEASRSIWTRATATNWFILYVLVAAISLLFSEFPNAGLKNWDQLLPWLVIYLLLINTITNRERFVLILVVYGLCNLKLTQFGMRQWILGGGSFADFGLSGPQGWFQNPGELAIQTAMFTPLALVMVVGVWDRFGRLGRFVLLLVPISAFVTTIGTHSRGGIIAVTVALVWAFLGIGVRLRSLVGLGALLTLGFFLLGDDTLQRFQTMGGDVTSVRRLTFIRDGFEIIGDHPVIGIGYFNWIPYYMKYFPQVDDVRYLTGWQLPHNILIQCASELGLIGLVLFLLLVWESFRLNSRTRKMLGTKDRFLSLVSKGLDASMIAFLVAGQFVTVLYYPYFWIHLAFAVALHESCRRELSGQSKVPSTHVGPLVERRRR